MHLKRIAAMGDHQQVHMVHQRKGVLEQNRWMLFMLCTGLMLFITIWLMFFHVSEDGLYYPKDASATGVPEHWVRRAIAYNTHALDEFTNYTVIQSAMVAPSSGAQPKLVCYYNLPADNGSALLTLPPSDLEASLCTHIHVAFASVVEARVALSAAQLEAAADVVRLKASNPQLKVVLSVGGAGAGGDGFAPMVADHAHRKRFIGSVVELVRAHHFDGVDLDWEFPAADADPRTRERQHFTQLLRELRAEIGRQTRHRFLVSVAVAAPVFLVDVAYDVAYMNEYADYVCVMTYDYHFYTRLTPFTGMNAPLYGRDADIGYFATLNINYTVHYWLHKGLQRDKMVVGLPTYGHSFRLINVYNHGLNAPANGYGTLGAHGFVGYSEICTFLRRNRIAPMFDYATRSPFATRHHEWLAFDDQQSLQYKGEYVRAQQLAGAMVYALNTDDHRGVCMANATSRFPLTKIVKWALTK